MNKIPLFFGLLMLPLFMSAQEQILFDEDWKFIEQDVFEARQPNYDDSKWQQVNLPHDWDIYHSPVADAPTKDGGGFYPAGIGWYRKQFNTPKAELVRLHFEGVYQRCEVYVNGQFAGKHAYGYTPFTIDITPFLYPKGKNTVAVRVDNSMQPNCRWYSGSGIYRHVWLQTSGQLHLAENGIYVNTPKVSENEAVVQVNVDVANNSNQRRDAVVTMGLQIPQNGHSSGLPIPMTILTTPASPTSQIIPTIQATQAVQSISLEAGEQKTVTFEYVIDHPKLWSPDSPTCYQMKVQLKESEKTIGQQSVTFGVREFTYDAEKGAMLNGKPILINGACVHHDDGVLGAMAYDRAEIRKVRQMKDAGFNLIRTSHNPTTRAFLDACDSIGMMVIGEAFDGWYEQKTKYDYSTLIDSCYAEDVKAMVMRDRNHPSIIAWSIGNEVMERRTIDVISTARKLKNAILKYDNTRPVTEALCSWDGSGREWPLFDPHAEVLDIVGYNYMIHRHAEDHLRDPKRVIWQTESYPRDAFNNWAVVSEHPYIIGDIVWTGLDYLGESGIGRYYYEGETPGEHYQGTHHPWHGAYCGDVDITGWRKPISHYREMLWNDNTPLYMAVKEPTGYKGVVKETAWSVWPTWESWNWKGWEGKALEVEVYTKRPEVRLYLNDELLIIKSVGRHTEYKETFYVPYQPGTLRAEAVENGNVMETTQLKTAGEPAAIRMTTDRSVIKADGQDLAFIIVEIVDKEGNVVPDAAIPLEITVKGTGTLMAAASADLKDLEPTISPRFTTWCGRGMVVVRSSKKKGRATVEVKSKLPTAKTIIQTTP